MNAGCAALPALLNIKHVMQQRQVAGIWNGKDELPVSIMKFLRVPCASIYLKYYAVFIVANSDLQIEIEVG